MNRLSPDAQPAAEVARPDRLLAEAESFLHPLKSPQRRLLAGALGSSLCLRAEWLVRVLDLVLVAVALDLGDAAIPRLLLCRIARPVALPVEQRSTEHVEREALDEDDGLLAARRIARGVATEVP